MSDGDHALREKIDGTRLTYTKREHGVSIQGSPFLLRFDDPVDPEQFCDEISTAADPWRTFGVGQQVGDEYHRLSAVLIHVEDGTAEGATEINLEVCPEWARVYVKGDDADADRIAEWVQVVQDEYEADVEFGGD